ncbi:piggyBac transposable element-derived protein 3-like [Sitophilus oryzae]|uniref:PiggyBac transposable element-derived protein 3-like n=1 Tax=Sitophilus oryzae TaxID=7048 RepID=A0A6J2YGZ5_SITOR|nr:piggyBac transposable element-derived protein 3-like [Sitophilus oryzae]
MLKPLTLNELLEEVERLDDDSTFPDAIVVLPPTNANGYVTDEDSGDEENVTMDNLPGSLLNSEAEPVFETNCDVIDEGDDEDIYKYTNMYAIQHNRTGDVSKDEMKCFFGVFIYSGYCAVARRPLYWENSSDGNHNIICEAISRNRFNFILQNLHCNNNLSLDLDNKFSKIVPFLKHLSKNFLEFAPVKQNHSIDESMIPYFGRHSPKQFIRGKPIRWGYKFWMGTDHRGYIEWFEPYQGSTTKLDERYKDLGLGANVVLTFADKITSEKGRLPFHLFF